MTTKEKSPPGSPSLSEIQARLQAAILSGDDSILETILDNSRTSRGVLFGVYRNAYVGRLTEILQNEYPALHRYCGDDEFQALARSYIAACPSRTQNARWFGLRLPNFLESSASHAQHPELAELALIEMSLSNAFDAPDAPVLALGDLSRIAPERWGDLVFEAHPSVAALALRTNAFSIWRESSDKGSAPAVGSDTPIHVVAWREGTTARIREMSGEEVMMWIEASRGAAFAVLCEMVATYDDPETAAARAAGYLQSWLASGMLSSARLRRRQRKQRRTSALID